MIVIETMGCFYHYFPCQDARPSLIEEDIARGNKKRNGPNEKTIHQKKDIMLLKCGNGNGGISI